MKRTYWYALALFVLLLAIWESFVILFHVRELILPRPSAIALNLIENMENGYFYPHIAATSIEVTGGFFIGVMLGVGLGFIVSQSQTLREMIHPYIIASQSMPKLALAPLFITWFGYGYMPKIVITALISFFPLFESTVAGLSMVDQEKVALFRTLRASPMQILLKLRLPTAIPYLFSGLRVAIVLSVVGAVVSEFIGATKGLGAVIMVAQGVADTPLMFSVFILLTLMGVIFYQAINLIESLFFKKYYHSRGTHQ